MSARAALDALLADVTPALRKAMERAYDLGYREAIAHGPTASAREPASDAAARASTGIDRLASDVLPQLPAPTPADARSNAPALFAWNQDSIQDDDDEDNHDFDLLREHLRQLWKLMYLGAQKSVERRLALYVRV